MASQAHTTRRALFAIGGAVAIAGTPVVAIASASADAELLDLGRQWEAAVARGEAATREADLLKEVFERSKPHPPRLRATQEDVSRGLGGGALEVGDPIAWATVQEILVRSKTWGSEALRHPVRNRWLSRFERATDRYRDRLQAHREAIGLMAAERECDAATERQVQLEDQIVKAPCSTMAGLKVKARAIRSSFDPVESLNNDWKDTAALSVINVILEGGLH